MSGYDARYGIFANSPIEIGTQQEHLLEFRPISQVKPGQTVEFNVGATSQYYMDLSRTRLCANVRILGEDGNTLPANSDVAFINLSLHSIFRQVDLFLNGKNLCGDISVNYPMKSIMDTLLEETDDYLKSAGRTEMFYKDE